MLLASANHNDNARPRYWARCRATRQSVQKCIAAIFLERSPRVVRGAARLGNASRRVHTDSRLKTGRTSALTPILELTVSTNSDGNSRRDCENSGRNNAPAAKGLRTVASRPEKFPAIRLRLRHGSTPRPFHIEAGLPPWLGTKLRTTRFVDRLSRIPPDRHPERGICIKNVFKVQAVGAPRGTAQLDKSPCTSDSHHLFIGILQKRTSVTLKRNEST